MLVACGGDRLYHAVLALQAGNTAFNMSRLCLEQAAQCRPLRRLALRIEYVVLALPVGRAMLIVRVGSAMVRTRDQVLVLYTFFYVFEIRLRGGIELLVLRVDPVVVLVDFSATTIHHDILITTHLGRNSRAHYHANLHSIRLRRSVGRTALEAPSSRAANARAHPMPTTIQQVVQASHLRLRLALVRILESITCSCCLLQELILHARVHTGGRVYLLAMAMGHASRVNLDRAHIDAFILSFVAELILVRRHVFVDQAIMTFELNIFRAWCICDSTLPRLRLCISAHSTTQEFRHRRQHVCHKRIF